MTRTFEPFREFDRLISQATGVTPRTIPMDVIRHEGSLEIRFDLPGVSPDGIDLTVEKRELTLTVERELSYPEGSELVTNERHHGTFRRTLYLADTLDTEDLDADYDQGVLTVSIPVAEAAKPRKVTISGVSPALETTEV